MWVIVRAPPPLLYGNRFEKSQLMATVHIIVTASNTAVVEATVKAVFCYRLITPRTGLAFSAIAVRWHWCTGSLRTWIRVFITPPRRHWHHHVSRLCRSKST